MKFHDIKLVQVFYKGDLYRQYLLFLVTQNSEIPQGYDLTFWYDFDLCENAQKLVFMTQNSFNKASKTCGRDKTLRFMKPPFLPFKCGNGIEISQETLQKWLDEQDRLENDRPEFHAQVLGHNK